MRMWRSDKKAFFQKHPVPWWKCFWQKTQCALPNHLKNSILKLFLNMQTSFNDISMGSIQATLRGKPAHFLVTRPWITGATPGISSMHVLEEVPGVAPATMYKKHTCDTHPCGWQNHVTKQLYGLTCAPYLPHGCSAALRPSNNTPTWIFTTKFEGKWAPYHRGEQFLPFCVISAGHI